MKFNIDYSSPLPLRDVVANALREAILLNQLLPGERLLEISLANELGVSRTPVRDAIHILAAEGLATIIPRRGAYVSEIKRDHLANVLAIRKALEDLAVRLACENITEEELQQLEYNVNEFKKQVGNADFAAVVLADTLVHTCIMTSTHNDELISLFNMIALHIYRFRCEYLKMQDTHQALSDEHIKLYEYIKNKDIENARKVIDEHISRPEKYMLTYLVQ